MRIIEPYTEIYLDEGDGERMLRHIEMAGRTCYKSEDRITDGSAERFARSIIERGHEAVLEHAAFSVRFVVDRGVSHEIVRHRVASYCQESTRYCNYTKGKFGGEITVIRPCFFEEASIRYYDWLDVCRMAESRYFSLLSSGARPEEARDVLPISLKTEVFMTANLREWRHFLRLRTAPAAHPQMREVAVPLLRRLKELVPVVFDDIPAEEEEER